MPRLPISNERESRVSIAASTQRQLWTPSAGIVFGANTEASRVTTAGRLVLGLAARVEVRSVHMDIVETTLNLEDGGAKGGEGEGGLEQEPEEEEEEEKQEEKDTPAEDGYAAQLPETTLDYKMPLEAFRAAREAPEGSPESYWSYTMYRHETTEQIVKVHYSRTRETTERVLKNYFVGEPVLGLDIEWMINATRWHGPRRNVCMVQLASPSRIGLFHLALYPVRDGRTPETEDVADLVAPTLRRILEDVDVLKLGVAIGGDTTRMRKALGIDSRGTFELSHLHRLVRYGRSGETQQINRRLVALAVQCREHLGLPMYKGDDVRSSDWMRPLNLDQVKYSASDAYSLVQIFSVLELERESMRPTPPRPALAELGLPIQFDGGSVAAVEEAVIEEAADEAEEVDEAVEQDEADVEPEAEAEAEAEAETSEVEAAKPKRAAQKRSSASGPPTLEPSTPEPAPESALERKASPRAKAVPKTPAKPLSDNNDPRFLVADEWATQYRVDHPATQTPAPCLRAYHVWYNDADAEPEVVGGILRDPPLKTGTVVGYILEAIRLEHLPYEPARLQAQLLDQLPYHLKGRLYRGMCQREDTSE